MKKFSFVALVVLSACISNQPSNGFIIHGNIKGLEDQYLYYDRDFHSDKVTHKDSFWVENGRFTLRGVVTEPAELDFYTKDFTSFYGQLIVENSKINYKADINDESKERIKGSFSHQLLSRYKEAIECCYQNYHCEVNEVVQKHLLLRTLKLVKEYPGHPVSIMGVMHLLRYLNTGLGSAELLQRIVTLLKPAFKEEEELKKIEHFANACYLRQVGSQFIQYQAVSPKGNITRLSDYYGESYIFINCWASWCGPCRKEYQYFKDVHQKFKTKGFQVVSISFDSKLSSWQKAINQDAMQDLINLSELKNYQNTISKVYGINQVPDNFLLDKNGTIVRNNIPAEKLMEVMEELYANE